ncbi:MAG: ABC-F family ATP-binding cassette domain-containing protein [Clostridiales bacterium]|nr:ABC-F family ATP-binding cassette domain-containing protein [Clostridiales bacterium]
MILLSVQDIRKSFGGHEVLKKVSFTLQEGERMGLVGVNGSGKSTLMKIIAGQETADDGQISIQKGLRVGYMAQQGDLSGGETVQEALESVFAPLQAMEAELRELEEEMARSGGDPETLRRLGSRYDTLTRTFERENGYGWRSAVEGVLAGLGLREYRDRKTALLSGGERTRLSLGRLLLTEPDLLLLDEPTNHLDLKSIAWLENTLSAWRGAVLVISHDRYFLDHVCGRMAELLMGTLETYTGNYTEYLEKRTAVYETRMKAWQAQQKEIARQEAIIATYRRFNREKSIRAAESREKRLEKMERLERPQEEGSVRFRFETRRRTGEDVLTLEELKKSYDGRLLFDHLKLLVRAGDRIALIGDNGTGKSTLLKCLVGEEKADAGVIRWGAGVDLGYYDQHQAGLHENKTVLEEVWDRFPRLEQYEVRGALGLFLFTGDEVFEPVHTLSGGERGRVCLTELMLRKDNVLLLDEPTNHLDMDSREVLEAALADFEGTIIAVSHDRYFINRFAEKVCVLEDGRLKEYIGNYDRYFEKASRDAEPDALPPGMTRTAAEKEKKRDREEKRRLKEAADRLKETEKQIAEAEAERSRLEAALAEPDTYRDPEKAAEMSRRYHELEEEIDGLYGIWEKLAEET